MSTAPRELSRAVDALLAPVPVGGAVVVLSARRVADRSDASAHEKYGCERGTDNDGNEDYLFIHFS